MPDEPKTDPLKAGRDIIVAASKAQEETAKAVSAGIGLIRDGGSFISRCLGDAPDELGKLLTERMRRFRLRNLEQVGKELDRLKQALDLDESQYREISFGDAIRATDAASNEDDPTIQELWARLILNASRIDKDIKITKLYVDLLNSIGSNEAVLLDLLYKCRTDFVFRSREEIEEFDRRANSEAAAWREIPENTRRIAVQNLIRLRCISIRLPSKTYDHVLRQENISGDRMRPHAVVTVDPKNFATLINDINQSIATASGAAEPYSLPPIPLFQRSGFGSFGGSVGKITAREMHYALTPLGLDLMRSCSVVVAEDQTTAQEEED